MQQKKLQIVNDIFNPESLDLLLENKFRFDRKYCLEKCFEIVDNNKLEWDMCPFEDPEWTYVLNRLEYCYDLCLYSHQTANMKYILKAKEIMFNYLEDNCLKKYHHEAYRTLDTGLRLKVIFECYYWFEFYDLLDDKEHYMLKKAVKKQVKFIDDNYSNTHVFSNWGLIESAGILLVDIVIPLSSNLVSRHLKYVEQYLKNAFFVDGMHWEQSTLYLYEILWQLVYLQIHGVIIEDIDNVLVKGINILQSLSLDGIEVIALGDSDNVDIGALSQIIGYITKDYTLVNDPKIIYQETINLLGVKYKEWILKYECTNVKIPPKIVYYKSSGLLIYKSSKAFLTFQNGLIGGGHGHYDNLHINYGYNDKMILVDPGRFNYNDFKRNKYKGRKHHNVCTIDNEDLKFISSWKNAGSCQYTPIVTSFENNIFYASSNYNLTEEIVNQRKIILIQDEILIVADYINSVDYEQNFVYHPSVEISSEKDVIKLGEKLKQINFPQFNSTLIQDWIAPEYNKEVSTTKLINKVTDNITINFLIPNNYTIEKLEDIDHIYEVCNFQEYNYFLIKQGEIKKYLVGVSFFHSANQEQVIKYNNKIIFSNCFVYDIKNKKITNLEY